MKPYGIDISHHNPPASLPWDKFAESSIFCIVRGSYGIMRDRVTGEHVTRARAAGLKVGLYHFYRPSQAVRDQLTTFRSQLELASITTGDVVPTIDVERDPFPSPGTEVSSAWQGSVLEFIDTIVNEFGDCMVYITQREFNMLGKPEWLLSRPLWVAHYTSAAKPATPADRPATIWQHRVAPYDPDGPGGYDKVNPVLDQNRLLGTLPLIGAVGPVVNDTLPPEADTGADDGLEDALMTFVNSEYERVRSDPSFSGAQALLEYERLDTDASELAPESHS